MHKNITKLVIVSSSILSVGALGVSGSAAAASIHFTGPGSHNSIITTQDTSWWKSNNTKVGVNTHLHQTATSGHVSDGGNTWYHSAPQSTHDNDNHAPVVVQAAQWQDVPHHDYDDQRQDDWNTYNPDMWRSQGKSFSDWWSGMMHHMADFSSYNWQGRCDNTSWQPTMSNWQDDWSSWSPLQWQRSGQSYSNWYSQFMRHMNQNYMTWRNNWDGNRDSDRGDSHSGDASNDNRTEATVRVSNRDNMDGMAGMMPHMSNNQAASISNTGPGSTNTIRETSRNTSRTTNTNDVRISNQVTQNARSGNVTVSHNTRAGNARSGDASNNQSTSTTIDINN